MNKFVRWQRQLAGCIGKSKFPDFATAFNAAVRMNRRHDGAKVNAYRCPNCGSFHVGRSTRKESH